MPDDLITVVEESEDVDSTIISRVRLEILWALSELGEDGATARHLKAGLNLSDGVLYANLKKLVGMGYLRLRSDAEEEPNSTPSPGRTS